MGRGRDGGVADGCRLTAETGGNDDDGALKRVLRSSV